MSSTDKQWFVVRVTRNRTQGVLDAVELLGWKCLEVFCPRRTHRGYNVEKGDVKPVVKDLGFVLPGFVFVRATAADFARLLQEEIPGLTPYYDHFRENLLGRNPYLTVPEREMENFRRYCGVEDEHKLLDQADIPSYLNGKRVRIISGPFAGVEGTVLRWKQMRRVFLTVGVLATFGTGFIRSCDFEVIE